MEGSKMSSIPSDEDFARADRLDAERYRNLDLVEMSVKQHFVPICQLNNIYILVQRDVNFRVYVFFKKDADLEDCKRNGITDAIAQFVREELERVGRGRKEDTSVAFEFDSHENVDRNFEGSYFNRLR